MEIPLKSKPKVSMVGLVDESKFTLLRKESQSNISPTATVAPPSPAVGAASSKNPIERVKRDTFPDLNASNSNSNDTPNFGNYKLIRTYSETETNNFDSETGHRLYDDGKIRPTISRANSRSPDRSRQRVRHFSESLANDHLQPRLYSRSHNEYDDSNNDESNWTTGLEDEYIPGLDFANMVYQWNKSISDVDLSERRTNSTDSDSVHMNNNNRSVGNFQKIDQTKSNATSSSNTPHSREASYLDLKLLHSQVAPQPIVRQNGQQRDLSFTRLHDLMKLRHPQQDKDSNNNAKQGATNDKTLPERNGEASTATLTDSDPLDDSHKNKKLKSNQLVNPDTGAINYEIILDSLPTNFNDLPYSQRKKIIKSYSESIDYSQFSLIAKQYFTDKFGSSSVGSSNTPLGFGGSSVGGRSSSFANRRSRRNSANTIAGRLLALSSSSDLGKLSAAAAAAAAPPKENVDEKGAHVLNYELGKVIGFGAWGTIRTCKELCTGEIRACKIVKSIKNSDGREGSSRSPPSSGNRNTKVLQIFKKEIEIWKQLHHPNILPLITYLETETSIFCITNRIFGGTLFELVSEWGVFNAEINNTQGPIGFSIESQRERIFKTNRCAIQIVEALMYMHEEKGIVHGDIKLENVLVDNEKMILCDFGMSRVYTTRLSRKNSLRFGATPKANNNNLTISSEQMLRSKSSATNIRKPLDSSDSVNTRFLFKDDSKIGISQFARSHGPSMQSVDLTPTQSLIWGELKEQHEKSKKLNNAFTDHLVTNSNKNGIESELPHSHIGSLPYASPELLLPSPPPLGPSADIWALGVLLYTMVVGKLPFQHPYEPRLRAFISAGKYNKDDLMKACLTKSIIDEEEAGDTRMSLQDLKREAEIETLKLAWKNYDKSEFTWVYDLISGCLEKNITKRYDLETIQRELKKREQD